MNELISDYDTSSFIDENRMQISGWCDWTLEKIFGGFGKWDALYFLKIAEEGYMSNICLSFRFILGYIKDLGTDTTSSASIVFCERAKCGWALNTVFFALVAVSLYRLSINLFGERNVALVSSLLFCFNPASVFMSSLYTESLFSCLQFTAL